MSYTFTTDDVAYLRSDAGERALAEVSERELTQASMISDVAELRRRFAPHDAVLIETVRCRRRARGKLVDADRLLGTDDAVQQATASAVAAHRAIQIADRFPNAVVHDVTCSIGAELIELARHTEPDVLGGVIGSDIDRVRLAMARHNTEHLAYQPTLLAADALTPTSKHTVILADPARRTGSSRVFRLDQLVPPLLDLMVTYADRTLIVKCAPGLDYRVLRDRFGFTGEVQITSLDGGVREATLWSGEGAADLRFATVLRSGIDGEYVSYTVSEAEPDAIVTDGSPGEWIIDPDGAVVRAGLVRHYAYRHRLWQLDPQIAYLTGDRVPTGERGFRILEQVGTAEKGLRKALAARDCGSLEILVRGLDVDPDVLRKRLKLRGSTPLALVVTRIGRKGVAFICEPGVRA